MTLDRFATALLAALAFAPATAISHPLDGLTAAEMERITRILREAGEANEQTRYPLIELIEPPKADVLAWSEGDPLRRRARVHFRGESGFRTAIVDITGEAVEAAGPAAGQPMVLFEEFTGAMNTALGHPEMVAGLARRGLTPGDVFCLPLTAGNYMTPEYEGTRLMKVPCYRNPTGSNYYAKPVEGLFAVVDLMRNEATRVVDEGVVPLPENDWGYTSEEVAARSPLRRLPGRRIRPRPVAPDMWSQARASNGTSGVSACAWTSALASCSRTSTCAMEGAGVRCSTRPISPRCSCPTWTRPRAGTSAPTWTAASTASACSSAR